MVSHGPGTYYTSTNKDMWAMMAPDRKYAPVVYGIMSAISERRGNRV